MRKRKLWVSLLWMVCTVALLVVGVVTVSMQQNEDFITTFYSVPSDKVIQPIRMVVLTDLHMNEFGENNERLVQRIQALKPDMICLVGDIMLKEQQDASPVIRLLEQLTPLAPVYYSAGNHEYDRILFKSEWYLIDQIEATGARWLDESYVDVTIKGVDLRIGGICKFKENVMTYDSTRALLEKMIEDEEKFNLLLCHYPVAFLHEGMANYPMDLALSGDAHGGQVRLPLIGGLYSKEQGILPQYTEGVHEINGTTVVISRGLGDSSSPIPRINNQPELVVVDLE